jgi:hypothetical protein
LPVTARVVWVPSFPQRVGLALVIVAAADFLLYEQRPWGLSLAILAGLVGIAVLAAHLTAPAGRSLLLELGLLLGAIVPLLEKVNELSLVVASILLAALALSASRRFDVPRSDLTRIGKALAAFLLAAPFRLLHDIFRWRSASRRLGRATLRFAAVAVWVMPTILGVIFLALFGAANPVIDYWFSLIDLWKILEVIEVERVVFWGSLLVAVWAVLRPRLPHVLRRLQHVFRRPQTRAVSAPAPAAQAATPTLEQLIFGRAAILRALVVFNLLFAVETVLDLVYLWGGVALPVGMNYATYAHRGAYPLIVTALLAALFVLVALRPGSALSQDRVIRLLVYAWVAQNVLLVISSIFRLDLYVGIYALTYWRVAAFIWMGLVATGLVLIIARIALGKSNRWLLSANLLALSVTLYACCFINFAALIARYNVEHSWEMSGKGVSLDIWYLTQLGPAAFPAIDAFINAPGAAGRPELETFVRIRIQDEALFRREQQNWRAWSFRDWRLLRHLDERTGIASGK